MDFIWKIRCNVIKDLDMRSFWITWVGPNPMMSVFRRESQREKFETDTEEEAA